MNQPDSDSPRVIAAPLLLFLATVTIGVGFHLLFPMLLTPVLAAVLQRGVIVREERYLELKFGTAYTTYRDRVRRWL
jgi:protein-S-isoprenylcysteine O-methyltransferase Ste14